MATELLTADAPGAGAFGAAQWGIFTQEGASIIAVDAVDSVEYARDYKISDYPQEKGAFESYNKVKVPYQSKVGFLINATRRDFLQAIEAAIASLDLVTVVTPEVTYASANLTHYGYHREARSGVTLVRVDVWCEEVRIVGAATSPDAQSTNAASKTESGQVQATPSDQAFTINTDSNNLPIDPPT